MLNGVSLTVRHGETIALVGPNGCGKTTLMNLLPRFWDVDSGAIRIDGHDIREVPLRSLRRQIGIVLQETILFQDTIANNIAYGDPRRQPATRSSRPPRRAYAHQFIMALPQGYDTMIGERGHGLSGGQRQRIALARAMLRDPAILILDEATSAVDIQDEVLIRKAIEEFARGRTTFLISHNLASIQFADRIVLLNGGRIEAVGTDHELKRTSPSTAGSTRSTTTARPPERPLATGLRPDLAGSSGIRGHALAHRASAGFTQWLAGRPRVTTQGFRLPGRRHHLQASRQDRHRSRRRSAWCGSSTDRATRI